MKRRQTNARKESVGLGKLVPGAGEVTPCSDGGDLRAYVDRPDDGGIQIKADRVPNCLCVCFGWTRRRNDANQK